MVFISGGHDGQGEDSDLVFEFNTATGDVIQRQLSLPQPVAGGSAALYKEGGGDGLRAAGVADSYKVLLFGGMSGSSVISQTWISTQSYPIAAIDRQLTAGLDVVLFPNLPALVVTLQLAVS